MSIRSTHPQSLPLTWRKAAWLWSIGLLLSTSALGQAQSAPPTSLVQVLRQAYAQGPSLQSAQATLQNATIQLNALKADPSTLVVALTQAQQAYDLARVNLEATRLSVMQNVVNAYLSLYEEQQNVELLQAQVALNQRNLDVAKARQATGNATALDVARAQTTLDSSKQALTNAQTQIPILSAQLAALLGVGSLGNFTATAPEPPKNVQVDLEALNKDLFSRLPSVLQVQQAVDTAALNVKLYDNDYTPAVNLEAAKTSLANNQLALDTAQKNALTSLSNAYQTAQSYYKQIAIAQQNVANAQKVVEQDKVALKAGTISALQLQTDQVSLQSAQYSALQAMDSYWKALAALSVAAGQDFTGLVQAASAK
ncbi:TolC family protein [Meiothermus granaticius]|uniref:Type I secretion outer membrane protein, TolC family n=1 Tax=Meiothermus granaticius NBRC 107808 TaxID=1227551 RepID=A0A399F987_9DEIN|nr:TolC family protein [Meiothermus granaticius]MCL6526904.1 TolC family protein [Thermaceae bacterium]RIH92663.1 type I secretion outer membrane protein, TolC family [Meiothermus granaticius NBRC 107808]GEM87571.1 transporter [Meiothermus granaticius NBRC 107808]